MSSKNSSKLNVPEAKAAMDKFKMEAASQVGVNLKNGYNGDLTSREAMDKFKMEAASEEDVYPPQRIFPTPDFWLKCRKNAFS